MDLKTKSNIDWDKIVADEGLSVAYTPSPKVASLKPQAPDMLGAAAGAVNKVYSDVTHSPPMQPLIKATGATVGTMGAGIGAAIGYGSTPFINLAKNVHEQGIKKGFSTMMDPRNAWKGALDNAWQSAKTTAKFGWDIGQEGAANAPAALAMEASPVLGIAAGVPLAGAQGYQGYKDIKEGTTPEQKFQGALELGSATMMGLGIAKGLKGTTKVKAAPESPTLPSGPESPLPPSGGGLGALREQPISPHIPEGASPEYLEAFKKSRAEAEGLLNPSKGEFKKEMVRDKDTVGFITSEGLLSSLEKMDNGKLDSSKAVSEAQSRASALDDLAIELADNTIKRNSLANIKNRARASISSENILQAEKNSRLKNIDELLDPESSARGDLLTDREALRLKQQLYKVGYDEGNPTQNIEARRLASELRSAIEENNPDAKIKELNKTTGLYIDAIRMLENAHGRVQLGGQMMKGFARMTGAIAGHSVPVPMVGSMLGDYLGGRLVDFLNDPARRGTAATKALEKFGFDNKYNQAVESSQKTLFGRMQDYATQMKSGLEGKTKYPMLEAPLQAGETRGGVIHLGPAKDTSGPIPLTPENTPKTYPTLERGKLGGFIQTK